jgi:hypothetical protein
MREIVDVINDVLEVVPETETKLRLELAHLRESACYAPPEGVPGLWRRGSQVLTELLGPRMETEPAGSWCLRVAAIWSGKAVT